MTSPVMDMAGILSAEQKNILSDKIRALHGEKKFQAQILIIPSLEDENIEDYSIKVAEAWKIGDKKSGDGVILLVAVREHKMRIEVGQGIEGVLTDLRSSRLIRSVLAPQFKRGDYYQGLSNYLYTLSDLFGGEKSTLDTETAQEPMLKRRAGRHSPFSQYLFPILFFGIILINFLPRVIRAFLFALFVPLMVYFSLGSLFGFVFYIFLSLVGFVLGLVGVGALLNGSGRGGHWGGRGGGGGFGGGSWGGGGGGFSGGGSSGSW